MTNITRLVSGRVPTSNSANVPADRYQFLDLSSAEPNLGTANVGDVLIYDTGSPGARKWIPQSDITGAVGELAYAKANAANVLAQAAYDTANVGYNFVNGGGTISGNTNIVGDLAVDGIVNLSESLTVQGNLTVLGNVFSIATETLEVKDPMIILGIGNYTTDILDIGFAGHYNDGSNAHTGLIRDFATKDWYLFQGYTPELSGNNNVVISDPSFARANLVVNNLKGNVVANGSVTAANFITTGNFGSILGASVIFANSFIANTSAYVYADGTTQNTSVRTDNYVQAAFNQANVTVGVDATQNTRIQSIETINNNQNTSIGIIQGVNLTQNTRLNSIETININQNTSISIIQGVDATQNSWISSNVSYFQGVDDTQNTQIQGIQGVDLAQNSSISIIQGVDAAQNLQIGTSILRIDGIQGVDLAQNSSISIIQGVDATQNVQIGGIQGVDLAQNSSISIIQGVDLTQNSWISSNVEYFQGIDNTQNSSISIIQGVDLTQNTQIQGIQGVDLAQNSSISIIQGVDATQNVQITAVNQFAQSAYAIANSAQANTIFTQGVDATQNTRLNSIETVNVDQNTAIAIIQGVNATQNTQIAGIQGVDLAQNSSISIIQGVDLTQNSWISSNVGYFQGINNTQNTQIQGIQGVDLAQNAAITIIQGVDVTQNVRLNSIETINQDQNTTITQVNQYAAAAFNKANVGGTFTGNVIVQQNLTVDSNLIVSGNLIISGNTTSISANNLVINDPMIILANNNTLDVVDIGFIGHYNEFGPNEFRHTGVIRHAENNEYYIFYNYDKHVHSNTGANNIINVNDPSFLLSNVNADYIKANLIGSTAVIGGINFANYVSLVSGIDATQNTRLNSIETINNDQNTTITQVNQYAASAYQTANQTNQYAQSAYAHANNAYNYANTSISYNDGVNATQNTRIGGIEGVDLTQNSRLNSIETVNVNQNTAISIIQGTDATQNVRLNSIETINSDQNTSIAIIQGTDLTQNSWISSNVAYFQGINNTQNTQIQGIQGVDLAQNSSISIIQGVDLTQNTQIAGIQGVDLAQNSSISIIQGVDLTQNTNITAVNNFAQGAFNKANNALANTTGTFAGSLTITGNLIAGNVITSGAAYGNISGVGTLFANTVNISSNIIFSDGSIQNTAFSGNPIDQTARNTANAASANTIIIQGVNATQNTQIAGIQGVDLAQNSSISIIQGVDLWQNSQIIAVNQFAQSAYDRANTANGELANATAVISYVSAVDLTQNSWISSNASYFQGIDNTQNTQIQGAYNTANVGYNFVNSGGTISGSVTISGNNNLTVTGNLNVLGTTTTVNTNLLEVDDPMIILANGNFFSDAVDIGFAGHYNDGTNAHTGFIRDFATKDWYLFQGYTPELSGNNNVNISDASFDTANLIAKRVTANVVATTVTIGGRDQASVDATQNSSISIIQGVDATQNTQIQGIQGVDLTQNSNISIIQGVDLTQNTQIQGIQGVDLAQNSSISIIQGVDLWQNSQITAVNQFAQSAYDKANTSITSPIDQFARDTANSAQANTIVIQGVDLTQNNEITAVNQFAQSAYDIANTKVNKTGDAISGDLLFNSSTTTGYPISYIYADRANSNTFGISVETRNTTPSRNTYSAFVAYDNQATIYSGNISPQAIATEGYSGIEPGAFITLVPTGVATITSQKVNANSYGSSSSMVVDTDITLGAWNDLILSSSGNTTIDTGEKITLTTFVGANVATWNFSSNGTVRYVTGPGSVSRNPGFKVLGSPLTGISAISSTEQSFKVIPGANTSTDYFAVRTSFNTSNNIAILSTSGSSTMKPMDIIASQLNINNSNTNTILSANANGVYLISKPLIFSDGSIQNTAFSGSSIDQTARDTANSAQANTIVIQGVDLTQNTRLDGIEGVNLAQNSSISIIQGVDLTQNSWISSNAAYTQAAFNTANSKFNSSGGTISGSVTISGNNNLTVTGNLNVLGNTFSVGTQTLEVVDPMIILGIGNYTSDAVDIGFAGHYNDGTNAHTGFIRDFATKDWYLFQGYTPELSGNNNVNISDASFDTANLIAKRVTANLVGTSAVVGGVDIRSVQNTQNTNITSVNQFTQSAFDKANNATSGYLPNAVIFANTTGFLSNVSNMRFFTANSTLVVDNLTVSGTSITNVLNTANANISLLFAIDNFQNTAIQVARDKANAAYDFANTITTFGSIKVSGQPDVIANVTESQLTLVAGSGMTITTVGTSNTITFSSTGGGGASLSGYLANTVIAANSTGFLSNSNVFFTASNNTLATSNVYVSNRVGFANANNILVVYQVYNANTNSLDTIFG
jgi:hypothetical protein